MSLSPLKELRAVSIGADVDLVEAISSDYALEALTEGANIQALKLNMSDTMKSAKANMKQAHSYVKNGNNAEAKKSFNKAISDLEKLKKEADEIDDDHIIIVALDAFVKSFIPAFASVLVAHLTGVTALAAIGIVGSYICGLSKSMDFSNAVTEKLTTVNHQGRGGKFDTAVWWKVGETRGAVMTKLELMITACKKEKDKLN